MCDNSPRDLETCNTRCHLISLHQTHTLKSYLITSTTKVNAVKNFNLRSEKEDDASISKLHFTSESETQKQKQSHPQAGPHPCMLYACSTEAGEDRIQQGPIQGFQVKDSDSCGLPWPRAVLVMIHTGLWKATHTALWHQGSTLKGSLQIANPS